MTLVELLVVIGIVGILISLFIPAVQRVREAANNLTCKSNLRQIGTALLLYHQDRRSFPSGCSLIGGSDQLPYVSWCTRILPYLEHDSLWGMTKDAYKQASFFLAPAHLAPSTTVVSIFNCPSEARTQKDPPIPMAFTHYLGCAGTDSLRKDGILFLDSRIRIADIQDGQSNTIMVGERPPSEDGAFGWRYAGWGQKQNGSCEMYLGVREINLYGEPQCASCPKGPFQFRKGGEYCDFFHFWSQHHGGANFLFADGSVRFLEYSVDNLLPALSTRRGRERVLPPE